MYDEYLVPPGARLLHLGPPKTGTSAVQSAFARARRELVEHGVLYPGTGTRSKEAVHQLVVQQISDLARWEALVAEVTAAQALRVCVSNEDFARADGPLAGRIVADLGGADRVHPCLVVRPLDAILPSQWQQFVRVGGTVPPYEAWLRVVLEGSSDQRLHARFWQLHDLETTLERWGGVSSPGQVTAIVSMEGDKEYLPRVFEGLMGLPEGFLVPDDTRSNPSLTRSGTELMRELDRVAGERGWRDELYRKDLKRVLSRYLRAQPRAATDEPLGIPAWAVARVAELNQARIETLAQSAARVVGDPQRLRREPTVGAPPTPEDRRVPVELTAELVALTVEHLQRRRPATSAATTPLPATKGPPSRRLRRLAARMLRPRTRS